MSVERHHSGLPARWRQCAALPVLCLLCAACASADRGLPDEIEWRSEHFVYHARSGDPDLCPGLVDRMEHHLEVIRAATGLQLPEGRMIHYYKFLDQSDYEASAGCPADTGGCARGGNAYSAEPFHEHELIHSYFAPLGSPPRILSEGVAELLGCRPDDLLSATLAASGPDDVEGSGSGEIAFFDPERDAPYVLGRLLVSRLVKAYGWAAFLDLYAADWRRRDAVELEQYFQALYGASYESTLASASRVVPIGSCVAAWACASTPLTPGIPDTPGTACADTALRSVAPAESGVLKIEAASGAAMLLECPADAGEPISGRAAFLEPGTAAELRHGNYFIVTSGATALTSQRLDNSISGTECTELGPAALELPGAGATWLFQGRTVPYYLRLAAPAGAQLNLLVEGSGPVQVCPGCDTSDECLSIQQVGTFSVRSGVVLHFPAGASTGELVRLSVAQR